MPGKRHEIMENQPEIPFFLHDSVLAQKAV